MSTASRIVCDDRNEKVSRTSANGRSASLWRLANRRFISASISGAAPRKPKIDCFSSPTANTVRFGLRAPAPAKNSARERRQNAPLRRRGVLGFVEKQVIEPVIELVQHPGGARPGQKRERAARSGRRNRARRARPSSGRKVERIAVATTKRAPLRSSASAARRRSRKSIRRSCSRRRSSSSVGNLFRRSSVIRLPFSAAARLALPAVSPWRRRRRAAPRCEPRADRPRSPREVFSANARSIGPADDRDLAPTSRAACARHRRRASRASRLAVVSSGRKTEETAERGGVGGRRRHGR